MPFDNAALLSLASAGGFNLWLYRTPDTRTTVLASGYFAPGAARILAGDLILLQASDSVALLPVRIGTAVGAGLVVDSTAAPFRVNRSAGQRFSVRQAASAVAMTVLLAPLAGGILATGTVQAQAAVAGPVAEVSFSIRSATGATVRGPQTATVAAGAASASFPAPTAGSGYRLRVEVPGNPAVADTSAPFNISAPFALLAENLGTLAVEQGGRLLL